MTLEVFQYVRSIWAPGSPNSEALHTFASGTNVFNWTRGYYDSSTGVMVGDDPDPDNAYLYPLYEPLLPTYVDGTSIEVWIRAHVSGTYSRITNMIFWAEKLDLFGYGAGAAIACRKETAYPVDDGPAFERELGGYSPMQVGQDNGIDITQGEYMSPGGGYEYSNYAVLQLFTSSAPIPGPGGKCDFITSYDIS